MRRCGGGRRLAHRRTHRADSPRAPCEPAAPAASRGWLSGGCGVRVDAVRACECARVRTVTPTRCSRPIAPGPPSQIHAARRRVEPETRRPTVRPSRSGGGETHGGGRTHRPSPHRANPPTGGLPYGGRRVGGCGLRVHAFVDCTRVRIPRGAVAHPLTRLSSGLSAPGPFVDPTHRHICCLRATRNPFCSHPPLPLSQRAQLQQQQWMGHSLHHLSGGRVVDKGDLVPPPSTCTLRGPSPPPATRVPTVGIPAHLPLLHSLVGLPTMYLRPSIALASTVHRASRSHGELTLRGG